MATTAKAYGALRNLGFGETESKRALVEVQAQGRCAGDDLEALVRASLGVLTRGSRLERTAVP